MCSLDKTSGNRANKTFLKITQKKVIGREIKTFLFLVFIFCLSPVFAAAPDSQTDPTRSWNKFENSKIEAVWLTYSKNEPKVLTINWAAPDSKTAEVEIMDSPDHQDRKLTAQKSGIQAGQFFLYRVDIPCPVSSGFSYRIKTDQGITASLRFKGFPTDKPVRVGLFGDWGYFTGKSDSLQSLIDQDLHLLVTLGDNVPRLWTESVQGEAAEKNTAPFLDRMRSLPELLTAVPILPILGNHDREIRPRSNRRVLTPGQPRPNDCTYDLDAAAFRSFFPLPDDGWKWTFTIPEVRLRLVALDMSHLSDQGTTYQTCHSCDRNSDQFQWFNKIATHASEDYLITIYNASNKFVRDWDNGCWHHAFLKANPTFCATGFGYYAEQSENPQGQIFFNSSLAVNGAKYPDSGSKYLQIEGSFLLLTFNKNLPLKVEFRKISDGSVMKSYSFQSRNHL